MLGISFILIVLGIIFISLFIKQLNLLKEFNQNQILLYDLVLKIQVDLLKVKSKQVLEDFKVQDLNKNLENNDEITHVKSSPVSQAELEKLMEGKDLVFKNQVNVNPGQIFIDKDIDIGSKSKI